MRRGRTYVDEEEAIAYSVEVSGTCRNPLVELAEPIGSILRVASERTVPVEGCDLKSWDGLAGASIAPSITPSLVS
jgi:hypothetical protein